MQGEDMRSWQDGQGKCRCTVRAGCLEVICQCGRCSIADTNILALPSPGLAIRRRMPAPRHEFSEADRELLRRSLEVRLEIPLDGKASCIKVSDMLKAKGGYSPSGTTLYHLLVAPTGDRRPYLETLHALARLLGFADWHSFRSKGASSRSEPVLRLDQVFALPVLLETCMRKGSSEVLDDFLDQWLDRIDHVAIFDLGLALYTVLYKHPDEVRPFIERYAAHPVVRRGLFELMADPDFQLAHADEGLQHYLSASKPMDDEQGLGDRLFARSMLFRHHILKGDARAAEEGRQLYTDLLGPDDLRAVHLFPAARYLTYAIWYDVLQRRTSRRKRRESLVIEWAAERLLQDRSELERDIIFHTLVEGSFRAGLLSRMVPEIVRLFPDVDPQRFKDGEALHRLMAEREPNGLRVHFKRVLHSA
jgi:hypothetical protein